MQARTRTQLRICTTNVSEIAAEEERQSLFRLGDRAQKRKKLNAKEKARLSTGPCNVYENLLLAEDCQKTNHRFNALVEIWNMEFLIGGVNVVIGKA